MKRKFGPSLYFASDKVVFDALNQSKVTGELVRELFLRRGIIVSAKTPKDELAQYFSRLVIDHFDHQAIAEKLGKVARRERVTYTEVGGELTREAIVDGLKKVKLALEAVGSGLQINVLDRRILATYSYEYIDYTETEFRQVQPRDAILEFIEDESGAYVLRNTQNKYTEIVVGQVFAAINSERDELLSYRRIVLTGFPDPEQRIKFFNELIKGLEGYQLMTVTEAYCYKPREDGALRGDDDEDNEKDLEEQSFVERVSLKGRGVTRSFVIDDLYGKGYFIVKVVWHVKSTSSLDSDIYELEAQFTEPRECTGFSYQVRSVLIMENGKETGKKRGAKPEEQDGLFRRIEKSAKIAIEKLENP